MTYDDVLRNRMLREAGLISQPTPSEEIQELKVEVLALRQEGLRLMFGWASERTVPITYREIVGEEF